MAPILTDQLTRGMQTVQTYIAAAPARPVWLTSVPLVGSRLGQIWDQVYRAGGDIGEALAPLCHYGSADAAQGGTGRRRQRRRRF
jgi:hypothetical protein